MTSTIQEVDLDGRYLILIIDFQNTRFSLTTVYAPVLYEERRSFFTTVASLIHCEDPNIICGDFNAVVDPTVDRYSAAGTRPRAASTAAICSFIRRLN